jgi:hypothetical protein
MTKKSIRSPTLITVTITTTTNMNMNMNMNITVAPHGPPQTAHPQNAAAQQ